MRHVNGGLDNITFAVLLLPSSKYWRAQGNESTTRSASSSAYSPLAVYTVHPYKRCLAYMGDALGDEVG